MDIPVLGPKGALVTEQAQENKKAEKPKKDILTEIKADINSQIIASHEKLTFSIKNNELQLLYKSAIEKLNEILSPIIGEEGLESVDPDEYSPEAVAERIVGFSTAFFEAYKGRHPHMDEAEALNNFMGIIEGAIAQGIGEAKEILEGMKIMEGDVETDIEKTYALIKEGLEEFRASFDLSEGESE